jgi:hypothetical protein
MPGNSSSPDDPVNALALQGWLQSRMELDRSLLTLSAAGIGLMVTLLTTIGYATLPQHLAYVASVLCFVGVVIAALVIFRRNAAYCERVAKGDRFNDEWLSRLDHAAIVLFVVGVGAALYVGGSINGSRHPLSGGTMGKDDTKQGVAAPDSGRSLNGLGNLGKKPAPEPAKPQPTTTEQSQTAPPTKK